MEETQMLNYSPQNKDNLTKYLLNKYFQIWKAKTFKDNISKYKQAILIKK